MKKSKILRPMECEFRPYLGALCMASPYRIHLLIAGNFVYYVWRPPKKIEPKIGLTHLV